MEFINSSGLLLLLLSVLIIFTALECSSAKCCEVEIVKDARFLEGRKMLQMMDKTKSSYLSGDTRPADVPQNTLYPQTTPISHGDKNVVAENVNRATKKNDESDALLEAADEVANLMRRDYRDYRRTPPINNHQPNN
ncbi:hypothetical protein OROGR_007790 [Orobanche gracilis]